MILKNAVTYFKVHFSLKAKYLLHIILQLITLQIIAELTCLRVEIEVLLKQTGCR